MTARVLIRRGEKVFYIGDPISEGVSIEAIGAGGSPTMVSVLRKGNGVDVYERTRNKERRCRQVMCDGERGGAVPIYFNLKNKKAILDFQLYCLGSRNREPWLEKMLTKG